MIILGPWSVMLLIDGKEREADRWKSFEKVFIKDDREVEWKYENASFVPRILKTPICG